MIYENSTHTLIDTHCHLTHMINKNDDTALSHQEVQQARKILHQAALKNVSIIIEVGTTLQESIHALELAKIVSANSPLFSSVYPTVGIHPHEADASWKEKVAGIAALLAQHHEHIVGVGECGLDKHYPDYNMTYQHDLFKAQIELAIKYDKALVVHTRDAQQETLDMLRAYKNDLKHVTIHCFSNSLDFAQEVVSWGWFLGIGGTVTYPKNNYLRDIVTTIGVEHIVLETDAPFLSPQVVRGTPNAPENIALIAEFIAQLTQQSVDAVAQITTSNARKLFKLED